MYKSLFCVRGLITLHIGTEVEVLFPRPLVSVDRKSSFTHTYTNSHSVYLPQDQHTPGVPEPQVLWVYTREARTSDRDVRLPVSAERKDVGIQTERRPEMHPLSNRRKLKGLKISLFVVSPYLTEVP